MSDNKILPDAAYFRAEAERVLSGLPIQFRQHLDNIVVKVEDFADADQLAAVGLDDKWQLSGLYHGRPVPDQSVWASGDLPPTISLFRRPLLAEWKSTGVKLDALIRHVTIHEAGHHFGFSDAEMHALEDDA